MSWTPITGSPTQYSTSANELASDYWLKFYQAGAGLTIPFSVATDSAGTDPQAKVKLNANGYPISNPADNNTVFIPHVDRDYRIVLYRSEADADANNTTNADFNIDGVSQDIAPSGTAADIALRQNTLLVQDDYDRSPLFIDGVNFTAGAGPHLITVPASWNPTVASARFYKLDNSGIVTPLTPTLTTSTTFTLAETLLATDVIFIGDDVFRNQMDGDPVDIRARLDVYSTSQVDTADNARLEKANNLSDVASASASRVNIGVGTLNNFYSNATGVQNLNPTTLSMTEGFYVVRASSAASGPVSSFIAYYDPSDLVAYGSGKGLFNGGTSAGFFLQIQPTDMEVLSYSGDAPAANWYIQKVDKIQLGA